jgi:lipoprotein-releasing system permease protein
MSSSDRWHGHNQQEDGTVLYVPLTTLRSVLDQPTGVSTYWIKTTSPDESLIDGRRRSSTTGSPHSATTSPPRSLRHGRDEIEANRTITTTIGVLGFLIVAMSMVALANAITMSIIERTREIGILRCLGARARDVRRIFATEGVALALGGWLLGIPLGYALTRLIVWLIWEIAGVRVPVVFPPWNIALALAGTVVLALLVMVLPVRRAVAFPPGEAIRYA